MCKSMIRIEVPTTVFTGSFLRNNAVGQRTITHNFARISGANGHRREARQESEGGKWGDPKRV